MNEPIDLYFKWLYSKVSDANPPSFKEETLLGELYRIEFVWLLPGDDNRAEDGKDLRTEYIQISKLKPEIYIMDLECTVLEMLIAFSRRAAFQTDETSREWFWIMVDNLGLLELNGTVEENCNDLQEIVDVLIWRTYGDKGEGGLFPLRNTTNNQRKVEIWYQFCEYIYERDFG